jgi:hypothetical protein
VLQNDKITIGIEISSIFTFWYVGGNVLSVVTSVGSWVVLCLT